MEYILILCKWFVCSSVIWHIIEKKKIKICNHPNNNLWRFEESSKASAGGDWCQTELNIEILSFLIISATCVFMKNHKRMQARQRYLRFIILSNTIPLSHPCISVSQTINNKINQRTVYPLHTFNSHLLFLLDKRKMTSGLSNVRFKWHERGIASSGMINTHVTIHKDIATWLDHKCMNNLHRISLPDIPMPMKTKATFIPYAISRYLSNVSSDGLLQNNRINSTAFSSWCHSSQCFV